MATIHDIEIFKPGKQNGEEFSDARVDAMIRNSNKALPYIQESIATGMYAGNETRIMAGRPNYPIPGLINFAHQRYLTETLRESVRSATIEFKRSGEWIVATIGNVKQEIAEFIQARFPFRSVEIIPSLLVNGEELSDVIRSIAFLPPDIEPAVKGQSPHVAVEYAASAGLVKTYSSRKQEAKNMTEETTTTTLEQTTLGVSVEQFASLQAQLKEMQEQNQRAERDKQALEARIQAETQKREAGEIAMYCKRLETDYHASPAFVTAVRGLVEKADNATVLEFAEGQKATLREEIQATLEKILLMQDSMTVPMGERAKQAVTDPLQSKQPGSRRAEHVQEFWAEAQSEARDPQNRNEVLLLATQLATAKYGDNLDN